MPRSNSRLNPAPAPRDYILAFKSLQRRPEPLTHRNRPHVSPDPSQAYESVLQQHGIEPEEDTDYYRFLLKLSLDPDPNWWVKYEREKQRMRQTTVPAETSHISPVRPRPTPTPAWRPGSARPASARPASARAAPGSAGARRSAPPSTFAGDFAETRRRVMEEYQAEYAHVGTHRAYQPSSARPQYGGSTFGYSTPSYPGSSRHPGSYHGQSPYGFEAGLAYEDPAESGYADFKLMAAAFRVWVRHASALRSLRVAREAAVENWMIAVSFWEAQTLRRCLARWRGRKNVMQLHALRFWYGETLRGRFLYWRELTTRLKIGMHTAGETHRAQVTKKYFYAWRVTASMSKEEQLKFARAMTVWGVTPSRTTSPSGSPSWRR